MRVREENCNMVLLATIALCGVAVVGGAALLEAPAPAPSAAAKPAYFADQTPVRVVGAPFVPNTNPRER